MTHFDLFDADGRYLGRKKANLAAAEGEGPSKVISVNSLIDQITTQLDLEEFPLSEEDCTYLSTIA
ncbi:hypothetical protein [Maritalea mediterranea]|uniref:Uncharacterized protein n=1 Tax=Maritalea mediterranea TaxID=2909667 RepID=A0ABS9EAL9_9HYPH|nr:hypothetical protein [Maritalea mediterranea]MCF4099808.1 hypothetical protein [Maritalea mediterranea]